MKMLYIYSLLIVAVTAMPRDEHHSRGSPADFDWYRHDRVSPETNIPIRIALRQRNIEHGMAYLLNVYASPSKVLSSTYENGCSNAQALGL